MLKSSLFCLGHALLIVEEVFKLHAHMVATNHWFDPFIAAYILLIIVNAIMFCLWAANGVVAWSHRADRLLDRQVRKAIKEGKRSMRIYKSLFGDYGRASMIVWEDVKDARTGETLGKAPRLVRADENYKRKPEEE